METNSNEGAGKPLSLFAVLNQLVTIRFIRLYLF